jgi:hypothetical protein
VGAKPRKCLRDKVDGMTIQGSRWRVREYGIMLKGVHCGLVRKEIVEIVKIVEIAKLVVKLLRIASILNFSLLTNTMRL